MTRIRPGLMPAAAGVATIMVLATASGYGALQMALSVAVWLSGWLLYRGAHALVTRHRIRAAEPQVLDADWPTVASLEREVWGFSFPHPGLRDWQPQEARFPRGPLEEWEDELAAARLAELWRRREERRAQRREQPQQREAAPWQPQGVPAQLRKDWLEGLSVIIGGELEPENFENGNHVYCKFYHRVSVPGPCLACARKKAESY